MAQYAFTFTSGDTVTPTKLNDARTISDIVNADVSATAAIAGTKVAPAFGAQDITVSTANRSITNTTNHALSFGTNNTERVRINNAGNVGIGNNAPGARLSVAVGSATGTGFGETDGTIAFGNGAVSGTAPSIIGHSTDAQALRIIGRAADGNTASDINFDARLAAGGSFSTTNVDAFRFSINGVSMFSIQRGGVTAIGTTSPNAAALLDISSTTRGFLPPRMTTANRDAISTPPAGLMIYNSSTNKLQVRTNTAWVDLH
jgi:hypothetical protein